MRETKFISEVEYLTFKQGLRGVLIKIAIGVLLGTLLVLFSENDFTVFEKICVALIMGGVPYTWDTLPFSSRGLLGLFIRLVISIMLGWVITPIVFIYNFVQMKRYEKAVAEHVLIEEEEKAATIERENGNTDRIVDAIKELKEKL